LSLVRTFTVPPLCSFSPTTETNKHTLVYILVLYVSFCAFSVLISHTQNSVTTKETLIFLHREQYEVLYYVHTVLGSYKDITDT
jgi:hypothetical protein